jgi:hypothetical protein
MDMLMLIWVPALLVRLQVEEVVVEFLPKFLLLDLVRVLLGQSLASSRALEEIALFLLHLKASVLLGLTKQVLLNKSSTRYRDLLV